MQTPAIIKSNGNIVPLFDDFFKPWNEWFDIKPMSETRFNIPSVNVKETKDKFNVSLAVPGMKKEDFKVSIDGNLLTVSSEKEDTKEHKDERFTRKEYNYSSFSRSFTLPDEVEKDKIGAEYENGILSLTLPKSKALLKNTIKSVPVK